MFVTEFICEVYVGEEIRKQEFFYKLVDILASFQMKWWEEWKKVSTEVIHLKTVMKDLINRRW